MIVTSEPPGALVRVGDEIVGETPLRHPFLHYGAVRVTLYDDEHLTYSKVVDLEPPWYGYPVVDVVSDLFPWRDRHLLHVRLKPLTAESRAGEIDSVLERAEVLRRAGPEGPELLPPRRNVAPAPGPPPAADAALEEEDEPPAPPPPPPGDGGAGRT